MKIFEWIQEASEKLHEVAGESSRLEAQIILAFALGKSRSWILTHAHHTIDPISINKILSRRLQHEPLPYILGEKEFYGKMFHVNRSVLIPRQETEILVETILQTHKHQKDISLLDLCTGSGCISISIKLNQPYWNISGSDISIEALDTAKKNAAFHNTDIQFIHSNMFNHLPKQQYDIIVSNPPYICKTEVLDKQVSAFEPHTALYANNNGLEMYQIISNEAKFYLKPHGLLYLEIGYKQSERIIHEFQSKNWECLNIIKDLSGHQRVLVFKT